MTNVLKALAVLFLLATPAFAQDDEGSSLEDAPRITMVGTAHADVAPDIATLTLGVTTEKPTAAEAADENARKAKAVIDAAKAQGVSAGDIATQSLTLTQTFEEIRDPDGRVREQKPRGFAAENIVAIRIRDLNKAGALAGTMIGKGANRLDGISFAVEHPEPIIEKLTGEAVNNARAQAQVAGQAAGVRLGRVLSIARLGGSGETMPASAMRLKRMAPAAAPVEPGTNSYEMSMEVSWAIEP